MFLNFIKKHMPTLAPKELGSVKLNGKGEVDTEAGKFSSEMSVEELRELGVTLELFDEKGAKKADKKALLKKIQKWEKDTLAKTGNENTTANPGEVALKTTGDVAVPPVGSVDRNESAPLGTLKGKKIVEKTEIEINGNKYVDIKVESGEVFREPLDL